MENQIKNKPWDASIRHMVKITHEQGKGRGVLEIDVFGEYTMVLERRNGWEIYALLDAKDHKKSAHYKELRQYVGFDNVNGCKYQKQGFELVISHSEHEDSDGNTIIKQEIARIEVLTPYVMFNDISTNQNIIVRKDLEHIERKSVKLIELPQRRVFAQV